jgi:glycine C-acetyltransferase
MFGDARVAGQVAERLLAAGIYVVAFSYPVVPEGAARIRTQLSAAHSEDELERAAQAFAAAAADSG